MSPEDSTVIFENAPSHVRRGGLRSFAVALATRVGGRRPFDCVLTDDAALRRLNRDYLKHDYPTDVLSFPAGETKGSLGDIAISVDRARAQAKEHGHSLAAEIRILMLHGVLHLRGFDHEIDNGRMLRAEARWRQEFGLPSGLIERAGSGGGAKPMRGVRQ